ncbi:hypothetical protein Tco_1377630 [Tanacetum coccineum]
MKDPGLFILLCRLGDSKHFDTLADLGSCVNLIPLSVLKKLKIGLFKEPDDVLRLADGSNSFPVGIMKNVEVHVEKLKLMKIFTCKKAKIAVGEGLTRSIFRVRELDFGEWDIAKDVEVNPFKDVLVFRKMVEFLGAIPINLKGNMWESDDLVENSMDWNNPPKRGDGS